MIFQEKKSANAGPSCGTGEGVAHSKRSYASREEGIRTFIQNGN